MHVTQFSQHVTHLNTDNSFPHAPETRDIETGGHITREENRVIYLQPRNQDTLFKAYSSSIRHRFRNDKV